VIGGPGLPGVSVTGRAGLTGFRVRWSWGCHFGGGPGGLCGLVIGGEVVPDLRLAGISFGGDKGRRRHGFFMNLRECRAFRGSNASKSRVWFARLWLEELGVVLNPLLSWRVRFGGRVVAWELRTSC